MSTAPTTSSLKVRAIADLESIPGFKSLGTIVDSNVHLNQIIRQDRRTNGGNDILVRIQCSYHRDMKVRYISTIHICPYSVTRLYNGHEGFNLTDPWDDDDSYHPGDKIIPIHYLVGPRHDERNENEHEDVGTRDILCYLISSVDRITNYLQQDTPLHHPCIVLTIGPPSKLYKIPEDQRYRSKLLAGRLINAVSTSMRVSALWLEKIDMDRQLWSNLLTTKVSEDHPLHTLGLGPMTKSLDDDDFFEQLKGHFMTTSTTRTLASQIDTLYVYVLDQWMHGANESLYPIIFQLFAGHPSLEQLYVTYNDINTKGYFESLEGLSRILPTLPKLRTLRFDEINLPLESPNERLGLKYLASSLMEATSLRHVVFRGVAFDEEDANEFCRYLASEAGSNLTRLELDDVITLSRFKERQIIMNALCSNRSIKVLELKNYRDGDASYGIIDETKALLQNNTTLITLELIGSMFWRGQDPISVDDNAEIIVSENGGEHTFGTITNNSLQVLIVGSFSKEPAIIELIKWVGSNKCKIEEFALDLHHTNSGEESFNAIKRLIQKGADRNFTDEIDCRRTGFLTVLHVKFPLNQCSDDRIQELITALARSNMFGFEELQIGTRNQTHFRYDLGMQWAVWKAFIKQDDQPNGSSGNILLTSQAIIPYIFALMAKNPSMIYVALRHDGSVLLPAVMARGAKETGISSSSSRSETIESSSNKKRKLL